LEKLPTAEKEEGFLQLQRQKSKGFHLPAPHFLHSKQPHQQVWFLVFLFFAKLGIWCVVFLSQTLLWFFALDVLFYYVLNKRIVLAHYHCHAL
jgi:hypothetical protein